MCPQFVEAPLATKKGSPAREADPTLNVRIPRALLARIDELVPHLQDHRVFALNTQVSRSDAVRLAILRGVEALEVETKRATE
jgi:hypothetical protein